MAEAQSRAGKIGGIIASFGFVASAAVRLLPHPWNAVPLGASAMMAAASLGVVQGAGLLFMTLLITDFFLWLLKYRALGFDLFTVGTVFVYLGYVGYLLAGRFFVVRSRWWAAPLAAIGASVFFFLVSNFGVWLAGGYDRTLAGLIQCYVAAIPFYRGTILGDVVFSTVFFGVWAGLTAAEPATEPTAGDVRA